jgi:hypothetical protein
MPRDADKPKPITREELQGMSLKDLAKVATKKRILASLPSADDDAGDGDQGEDVGGRNPSPAQRMARGHAKRQKAREAARTSRGGGDDGDDD